MTEKNEVESLRVAMLGTEDGGFLDPDNEIPAGEMFRLASEWLIAAGYTKSPQVGGVVEWGMAIDGDLGNVENGHGDEAWVRGMIDVSLGDFVVSRTVTPWKPEETA